jgi:hypothetical protein
VHREALSTKELDEIERQVLSGGCPPSLSDDVQMLVRAIRELQKHVRILETVARANSNGRLQGQSETAVF